MVGCLSFFIEWECVSLLLFLLGGTTYRGPNYLPPSSWSCQSSTRDSRCLPVSLTHWQIFPLRPWAKLELETFRKMWIQYSICSFPFKMSWDIGTSNKTLERYCKTVRWFNLPSLTYPRKVGATWTFSPPNPVRQQAGTGLSTALEDKWDLSSAN